MRLWIWLVLVGCKSPGASGDDQPTPDGGNGVSAIEQCTLGGGTLSEVFSVSNRHGPVTSIVAGPLVVLGSEDGSVKQWTIEGASADQPSYGEPFRTTGSEVTALAFGPDGYILAASTDGAIAEWTIADGAPARTNMVSDVTPSALGANSDGAHLVLGTTNSQILAVERATGAISPLETTLWETRQAVYGAGNRLLTAGHFYNTPMIERRAADAPATVVDSWNDARDGTVRGIALDAQATTLVAAGDHFVGVFATDQLAAGPSVEGDASDHLAVGAVMLPGGALFATVGSEGTLKLWRTATAELVTTLTIPEPIGVAVDSDGARLFTSGPDGYLHAFGCQ